jgi:hypothetical protein
MATIKIKRSSGVEAPSALALGELAITYGDGLANNAGDRVFAGTGELDANTGLAVDVDIIGGKYFTDMLDHDHGIVTAESALIVDADKKLNELFVDQIKIDGDTISSTGNIVLTTSDDANTETSGAIILNGTVFNPAGASSSDSVSANTGTFGNITISDDTITHAGGPNTALDIISQSNLIDMNSARITGVSDPVENSDVVTKGYIEATIGATSYTFGDGGGDTDNSPFDQTFTFKGANQAADAETYADGVDIATDIANNILTFTLTDTGVTANTYGSENAYPIITVDDRGRITGVTEQNVSHEFTITNGETHANGDLIASDVFKTGETLTFTGGTGVTTAVSNNEVTFSIGQDVATNSDVTFNDVTVDGNLYSNDITATTVTIYGNLTVVGNTTTVNTEEINLADNKILLNSNQDSGTAPTQDAGIEVNRGSANNVDRKSVV